MSVLIFLLWFLPAIVNAMLAYKDIKTEVIHTPLDRNEWFQMAFLIAFPVVNLLVTCVLMYAIYREHADKKKGGLQ